MHRRPCRHALRKRGSGRRTFLPAWLALLALVVAFPPVWAQSSGSLEDRIGSQKDKLREIEREIKRHRAKSDELKKKESNVANELSYLNKEIALSTKYLSGLKKKEDLLAEQIDGLRTNIAYEGDILSGQKQKLAVRLRRMYMRGPEHEWIFVLGGSNMADKMRRYKFMRMVAERDAKLIREVGERKQGLELEQTDLTEALAEIASLKRVQENETEKLQKNKRARVAMLDQIRRDESKHAKAIEELEASQERLKNLIGELERKRLQREDPVGLPPGGFAKLKGSLNRPVDGKVIGTFGKSRHPTFGTVTFNNGIDIQAVSGAPVRAVAAGRVEFVDWIDGYGNCIIINHGGGYYTLYAHASEIFVRPDQSVSGNEVIAEVGDTGSLQGYACHFEIRKSKQALNPMEWLAK